MAFKDRLIVLQPYKDVIVFVVTLLVAHFFWKLTFIGDEAGDVVTWLGVDVTAVFSLMAQHIATVTYHICHLFTDGIRYVEPYLLRFDTGSGIKIIWGCTGLKQSFIWLCLMLTALGSWRKKLWYIPLGWLCIYVFNIFRIVAVALVVEHHPDLFELFHTYIFKYMFYFMLFLLWVLWTERIGKKD